MSLRNLVRRSIHWRLLPHSNVFDPEGRYFAKFYHLRAEAAQVFRKNKVYVGVEEEAHSMDLLRRCSLILE